MAALGLILGLLGFALGRVYPAHHYQPFSSGPYLYDIRTGKACSPFRDAKQRADAENARNSDDPWVAKANELRASGQKSASDMIPACGTE
jgi:hypothetical protein